MAAVLLQLGTEEENAADQVREGDELQHGDGRQVHSMGGIVLVQVAAEVAQGKMKMIPPPPHQHCTKDG